MQGAGKAPGGSCPAPHPLGPGKGTLVPGVKKVLELSTLAARVQVPDPAHGHLLLSSTSTYVCELLKKRKTFTLHSCYCLVTKVEKYKKAISEHHRSINDILVVCMLCERLAFGQLEYVKLNTAPFHFIATLDRCQEKSFKILYKVSYIQAYKHIFL